MTSTQQLDNYRKNIPGFLGTFAADELPSASSIKPRPGGSSLIVNYSPINDPKGGTHWVAFLRLKDANSKKPFYFDSYGVSPDNDDLILNLNTDFRTFLKNCNASRLMDGFPYEWNKYDLQAYRDVLNGSTCGEWSCWAVRNGPPVYNDGQFLGKWSPFYNTQIVSEGFKPTTNFAFARNQKNEILAKKNDYTIRKLVGIKQAIL